MILFPVPCLQLTRTTMNKEELFISVNSGRSITLLEYVDMTGWQRVLQKCRTPMSKKKISPSPISEQNSGQPPESKEHRFLCSDQEGFRFHIISERIRSSCCHLIPQEIASPSVSWYSAASHQVGKVFATLGGDDSQLFWQGCCAKIAAWHLIGTFYSFALTRISDLDCRGKWRRIHCPGSVYFLNPQNLRQHLHFHVSRRKNPMLTSPTILYEFTQWARRILSQIRNL